MHQRKVVFIFLLIKDYFCWKWYSYKVYSFFVTATFFLLQIGIVGNSSRSLIGIFPLHYERLIYEGLIIGGLVLLFLLNKEISILVEKYKNKKNGKGK